mgnify:CR=1 FL=1
MICGLRTVIYLVNFFPSATYVVDKYHYARQVLWAFDAVRKEVQKDFCNAGISTLNVLKHYLLNIIGP